MFHIPSKDASRFKVCTTTNKTLRLYILLHSRTTWDSGEILILHRHRMGFVHPKHDWDWDENFDVPYTREPQMAGSSLCWRYLESVWFRNRQLGTQTTAVCSSLTSMVMINVRQMSLNTKFILNVLRWNFMQLHLNIFVVHCNCLGEHISEVFFRSSSASCMEIWYSWSLRL